MKNSEAYVLMALGIAIAYYATKPKKSASSSGAGSSYPPDRPVAIEYGTPNGWQYFSNGTAIGPDGTYYYQGQPVWNPSM